MVELCLEHALPGCSGGQIGDILTESLSDILTESLSDPESNEKVVSSYSAPPLFAILIPTDSGFSGLMPWDSF